MLSAAHHFGKAKIRNPILLFSTLFWYYVWDDCMEKKKKIVGIREEELIMYRV